MPRRLASQPRLLRLHDDEPPLDPFCAGELHLLPCTEACHIRAVSISEKVAGRLSRTTEVIAQTKEE